MKPKLKFKLKEGIEMLINTLQLIELIKNKLPNVDDATCSRIAKEIGHNVEAMVHSTLRQIINHERQRLHNR